MSSQTKVKVIVSSRSRNQVDQNRIAKRHGSLGYVSSFLKNANTSKRGNSKSTEPKCAEG